MGEGGGGGLLEFQREYYADLILNIKNTLT